ncbi:oxidoreductase [uncultured Marinobacter sp.]|uniref:oxidoreductase n=1 Tax=uncultured Marinobacter sp. TaxID=187379 RepID=UPI00262413FF|nr:oxidoreductase [uncultured Marinobacter sp.]
MMLKGKNILVVGAAGLLGREIVKSVIREGGQVVAADVSAEALDSFSKTFGSSAFESVEIDITSKDSVFRAIEFCERTMGALDGAVNTAYPRNKNYGRKVLEVTHEDFSENLGLHLGGYFIFMQQCAAYAQEKGEPFSLVSMSSIYGVMAPRFEVYEGSNMTMPVEYAAIKSALLHLNKYFASYMKGSGFRANSVSPGGLLDGQNERFLENYNSHCMEKGMLDPSDITGAVNFLLSDSSRYMAGQNVIVDDGFSV